MVDDLKLWADPWNDFPCDVKYSHNYVSLDTFVVTSNYSIDDLDINDVDKEALKARFT